eukprot:TRINITY_DN793_c0_g1_i1.p1 TRINITY_DN793_c0_g1~~TRINITY_DN793_c0_g1_i1.p1  ORF type:complete len:144 (+),score=31.02 TRINITY_DN793_c0_g1_i1:522-953(+)
MDVQTTSNHSSATEFSSPSSSALKACQLAAEHSEHAKTAEYTRSAEYAKAAEFSKSSGTNEEMEDECEAASDADSIASDEWAEALWSPGMCSRAPPAFRVSSDEYDFTRSLSMLKESADEWPADVSVKGNFMPLPGQRRKLIG